MLVKILIVEDESLVAMDMSDMLMRIGYEVLPAAYSYEEAVAALEVYRPDLVLMDIQLGTGRNGLDLAQLVREKYNKPFIFITSHSDRSTVSQAAALKPNGYLVKPFGQEDLYTCIEIALANFVESPNASGTMPPQWQIDASVFVKTDTKYIKLNISDIHYLESDGNYIHIVTDKAKHIIRSSFRDFLPNLPADFFMQIHKSYVIHLQKVESLSHTEVTVGKATIPLSRNYKDDLFEKIRRIQ
ncbi:MAG: response regulator [Bacteroidetes bacterium]|nr:response regulator [Bacteroidota bacterium]